MKLEVKKQEERLNEIKTDMMMEEKCQVSGVKSVKKSTKDCGEPKKYA